MNEKEGLWISSVERIIGVGPNYRSLRTQKGLPPVAAELMLFMKNEDSLTCSEQVSLPADIGEIVCEVEIAVLIGCNGYRIPVVEAEAYITGCALANDISALDKLEWGQHKLFPSTTPVGPLTAITRWDELTIGMKVNGQLVQEDHSSRMLFSVPQLITYISSVMPLKQGDLILTGTPANPTVCRTGDIIELFSPELGTVRHTLRIEEATQ